MSDILDNIRDIRQEVTKTLTEQKGEFLMNFGRELKSFNEILELHWA